MNKKVTEATDEEQEVIRQNLAHYPTLHSIISEDSLLYRVSFDQYMGRIPPERYDDVAEFFLGGILLYSHQDKQFQKLLEKLEGWLKLYPEYSNREFGEKILNNFFNFFSEFEVYNALRFAGCLPERDVALTGKTKNLDFKVCPDGRDILIEVTTPRQSRETDLMFDDTPLAGFFNHERGIEREGYSGPPRVRVITENKITNQISEATNATDFPVILIINCTYAYPEINEGCQDTSGCISGMVLYRNGTSEFFPAEMCHLSDKERRFFTHLMEPNRVG
jgi:hypothetical protein